jgi:LysR family hydrogen peroxide-inducible transcriptional activator
MTLQQLMYVVAVAKHRNFSVAAEKCFVTQPTLSMQIQKLEDELGMEIFDRRHTPIEVTSQGRAVVQQAQAVLAEADRLKALAKEEIDHVAQEIRIGVIPTLGSSLIPRLVSGMKLEFPETRLIIEERQTKDVITSLKAGELDLGLVVTPLDDDTLMSQALFLEAFYLYINDQHPLAQKKSVDRQQLQLRELWLLSEGHCFREQAMSLCSDRKRVQDDQRPLFESGSLETLRKMVDQTGGYTLMPELTIEDLPAPSRKNIRPIAAPAPAREVSLVHHQTYRRRATIDAVAQAILSGLPAHLTEGRKRKKVNVPLS